MCTNLEFPKDEVKNQVKWIKGYDFMDKSPRYSFEGRDPALTYERFQVVIYRERECEFLHDPSSARYFYYGYVRDNKKECADTVGRFRTLLEAKEATLELFNEYMRLFSESSNHAA